MITEVRRTLQGRYLLNVVCHICVCLCLFSRVYTFVSKLGWRVGPVSLRRMYAMISAQEKMTLGPEVYMRYLEL